MDRDLFKLRVTGQIVSINSSFLRDGAIDFESIRSFEI